MHLEVSTARDDLNECLAGKVKLRAEEIATNSAYIRDKNWQRVRLSMKGIPTHRKIFVLETYIRNNGFDRRIQVQVTNYINALKRGGQLSIIGEIQR